MKRKNLLITGGCGFVGHHVVEHFLRSTNWEIKIFDKLTYASSGFDRVRDIKAFDNKRVTFFTTDLTRPIPPGILRETKGVNYILHLAAETHVENSIVHPEPFVMSNVLGTMHMLTFARKLDNLEAFNYFSTDEVFGFAPKGVSYKEWDRYNSSNPYAASKAGGEELAMAYATTYNLPIFITHTMNCFGERQHPEKFIPHVIKRILENENIDIYADPTETISGSRFWIHCRNVAHALQFLLGKFEFREKYNIVGERETTNLDLMHLIAGILNRPAKYKLFSFHSKRPGHDLRYALDGSKMEGMGWKLPMDFEESLRRTVVWTLENKRWLGLKKGASK